MRLAGEVLSLLPNYLRVYVRARAQERGEAGVMSHNLLSSLRALKYDNGCTDCVCSKGVRGMKGVHCSVYVSQNRNSLLKKAPD